MKYSHNSYFNIYIIRYTANDSLFFWAKTGRFDLCVEPIAIDHWAMENTNIRALETLLKLQGLI